MNKLLYLTNQDIERMKKRKLEFEKMKSLNIKKNNLKKIKYQNKFKNIEPLTKEQREFLNKKLINNEIEEKIDITLDPKFLNLSSQTPATQLLIKTAFENIYNEGDLMNADFLKLEQDKIDNEFKKNILTIMTLRDFDKVNQSLIDKYKDENYVIKKYINTNFLELIKRLKEKYISLDVSEFILYLTEFVKDPKNQIIKDVLTQNYKNLQDKIKNLKERIEKKLLERQAEIKRIEKEKARLQAEQLKKKEEEERIRIAKELELLEQQKKAEAERIKKLEVDKAKTELLEEKIEDDKEKNKPIDSKTQEELKKLEDDNSSTIIPEKKEELLEERKETEEDLKLASEENLKERIQNIKEGEYLLLEKQISILEALLSYLLNPEHNMSQYIYSEFNIIAGKEILGPAKKGGAKKIDKIEKIQSLLNEKKEEYNNFLKKNEDELKKKNLKK
jgi:hypothetical protein